MNFNYTLTGNRFIKFDEKKNGNGNEESTLPEDSPETAQEAPVAKPITLSIQDVMASYTQGGLKVIATTGNNSIPDIDEGVTTFEYRDSEVTTYKKGIDLSIQVRGKADIQDILKKLPNLKPIEILPADTTGSDGTNGINSEIDEKVSQGGTGDCWILTGVLALNSSEIGKQIIKESIQVNNDGSVTVHFKGLGVSYTISADEIKKHDTDSIKNDAYSNGDNDMLVLELATKKLMADIASGKVKLNVPADSVEAIYNEDGGIEGGFAQNMIYYLSGEQSDFAYAYGKEQKGLPADEVINFLKNAYKNGNSVLTFGVYGSGHSATEIDGTPYKLNISGGHALAITNLTATTVTFVNPWDSTKEYTMTYEEFAKLGIGMITATDLSELDNVEPENPNVPIDPSPIDPVTPDTPVTPDSAVYEASMFSRVPQSIIDNYLEINEYNADGSVKNYVLKSPYTKIELYGIKYNNYGFGLVDGSYPNLGVYLTSVVDGKEVEEGLHFYTKENLNKYLGGIWWQLPSYSKYFNYDEKTGFYSLKDGMTFEELENSKPQAIDVDHRNYADPNNWQVAISTIDNKTFYPSTPLTTHLSQGIIDKFFTPETDPETGETKYYSLKEPFTGFKLESETDTHKTYQFSYVKDGIRYISTVKIDKSDGSYQITNSQEEVKTSDDGLKLKNIAKKNILKK